MSDVILDPPPDKDGDRSCGEGCGRNAVVEIDEMTFCGDCLGHLVHLGRAFVDACGEVEGHLGAMS